MSLPKNWRTLSTNELETYIETYCLDCRTISDEEIDNILDELTMRDAQAGANRGEMTGLPPEY